MYKVLISDKMGEAGLRRLDETDDVTYEVKLGLGKQELQEVIPPFDGLIVRSGTQVDAALLQAAKKLQVVGRAGIGVDNIDIRAATHEGIIVMNTPQANSIATAEQTVALMLALSRHTATAHASLNTKNAITVKQIPPGLSRQALQEIIEEETGTPFSFQHPELQAYRIPPARDL